MSDWPRFFLQPLHFVPKPIGDGCMQIKRIEKVCIAIQMDTYPQQKGLLTEQICSTFYIISIAKMFAYNR